MGIASVGACTVMHKVSWSTPVPQGDNNIAFNARGARRSLFRIFACGDAIGPIRIHRALLSHAHEHAAHPAAYRPGSRSAVPGGQRSLERAERLGLRWNFARRL